MTINRSKENINPKDLKVVVKKNVKNQCVGIYCEDKCYKTFSNNQFNSNRATNT